MSRPKEFNEHAAIDKAMTLFRLQGYKGTSLQDLTKVMGISKSSFYDSFGSKRELYLSCLSRFHDTKAIYNYVDPKQNRAAKTVIKDIYLTVIDSVISGNGGCMFAGSAMEFSNSDANVTATIANGISHLEKMFQRLLKQGKKDGEFANNLNVKNASKNLISTFYGLQIMARTGADRQTLLSIITETLKALK